MLAGRSVLAWQAQLAREMGCTRIICLCEAPSENLLSLQREIESAGGEFHAIRGNLQLVSLMRADDDLVLIADGLLPDRRALSEFMGAGDVLKRGVATIPASHSLTEQHAEDFERIDRDRHWAGFAVMRADQVQKLADLPSDGDAMSLLLRLALQARVECRSLAPRAVDGQGWILASHADVLAEREQALVTAGASVPAWTGPSRAAAGLLVRETAPRQLDKGPEISTGLAAFFAATGIALAGFGFGAAGLGMAAIGALAGSVSGAWSGLRRSLWAQTNGAKLFEYTSPAIDIAALVCLILVQGWQENPITQIALPVLAIGLARLASGEERPLSQAFWKDRALHLAGFAIAAATGYLGEALAIFACAALIQTTHNLTGRR